MPKYKLSPEERAEKAAIKEKIKELMSEMQVNNMNDINSLFKKMVGDISENGHTSKTMKIGFGDAEIVVPRDRNSEFEPQLVKKQQRNISQDIEEKILSMYAKGMSQNDISTHILEIYRLEVSDSTISHVTDKILPLVNEWQQRPLESIYAVVFMDAIHYHVHCAGGIINLFQISSVCQDADIHNQFYRKLQPSAQKSYKGKAVFPNDDSLMKMLYLAQSDITRKWTGRRKDWGSIRSQLDIYFAERLPE